MINTAPLRRTTLHFSHIGFTDARPFITDPCHSSRRIVGSSLPDIPGTNHSTDARTFRTAPCPSARRIVGSSRPYLPGPNHSTAATGPRRTREIRRVLLRLPGYREPTASQSALLRRPLLNCNLSL